jgi:hypothetical protein
VSRPAPWTGGRVGEELADPSLPVALDRLGLRPEDGADLVPALRSLDEAACGGVAAAASLLEATIGGIGQSWPDPFAELTDEPGLPAGLLPFAALVLTADAVRAHHRGRGVDAAVSDRTLTDLGQQVRVHRQTFGAAGLHTQRWLTTAWGGGLLWLGRLQFELRLLEQHPARWVLSVHIPQTGPLAPEAVDDAFAQARRVFAAHYPERPATAFHCTSWLLDPRVADVLAATSNLARFQRRWDLQGERSDADADALFFVFHRRYDWSQPGGPDLELASLPQETSMQRAVVEALRSGRRWQLCTGFAPLDG